MKLSKKAILVLPFRSILFICGGLLLSVILNQSLNSLTSWWSVICSVVNIITLFFLVFLVKSEGISFKKLVKYEKGQTKIEEILIGIAITLVIGMGGMYLAGALVYNEFPYMAVMMIQPIPIWFAILNIFVLPITTTLAEDGLYLGYALNRINKKWTAILLPSFFYALQHSFIPFLLDWRYMVYRLLSFLPLTIIYAIWYRKKQNPLPIMVGHFIINIATALQIGMTSVFPGILEAMQ